MVEVGVINRKSTSSPSPRFGDPLKPNYGHYMAGLVSAERLMGRLTVLWASAVSAGNEMPRILGPFRL